MRNVLYTDDDIREHVLRVSAEYGGAITATHLRWFRQAHGGPRPETVLKRFGYSIGKMRDHYGIPHPVRRRVARIQAGPGGVGI